MKTMVQLKMNQIIMKNINTLTPYNKVVASTKVGDELTMLIIHSQFFLLVCFFFSSLSLFL